MTSNNHTELWNKCLAIIRDNIGPELFDTWFRKAESLGYADGAVTIKVPSEYFKEHYEDRFYNILKLAMRRVYGNGVKLYYNYDIVKDDATSSVRVESTPQSHLLKNRMEASMQKNIDPFQSASYAPVKPQLNPALTFENYCVGESNKLPYTIAEYIAEHPEKREFNPFFLYGSVGVGKTHLIEAIGIRIKENRPQSRVVYISSKMFEQHVAQAYMSGKVPDLINFYQSLDVLLIDDIQEISNKKANQEALFAIFNYLHQRNRILIMTSDRAPAEMEGFADRLVDRFKWGVTEKLERPDYALRKQILTSKAERNGLDIPADVIDVVAARIDGSVRELEGVVMGLMTRSIVTGAPITREMAEQVIGTTYTAPKRRVNFDMILEETADSFNVSPDVLFSSSRQRDIVDARQVVMYLCRKLTDLSLPAIGNRLNRKHTTVLHGITEVKNRVAVEKNLAEAIHGIEVRLTRH